jgi:AbrB family looped-hinge helix DNA binding protein
MLKKQARVTSKGQITLPFEVRRKMGVHSGDRVEFEEDGAEFRVRPVRTESPFAKYAGIGNPGIPRGRKAIIRYIRKMRGHDDGD